MIKKKIFKIILINILFVCSFLLVSCSNPKSELEKMNIPYNEEAFFDCIKENNIEAIKLFLDAGMNPNVKYLENSAIIFATEINSTEIVKLLIDKGADINAISNQGNNLLMIASKNGNIDLVKLIIEKGLDPNKKDEFGRNALMIAANQGHLDIVKLLMNKVKNIDSEDNNSFTALAIAKEQGYNEIVNLLKEAGAKDVLTNEEKVKEFIEEVINECINTWQLTNIKGDMLLNPRPTYNASQTKEMMNVVANSKLKEYIAYNYDNCQMITFMVPRNGIVYSYANNLQLNSANKVTDFVKSHGVSIGAVSRTSDKWYSVEAKWALNAKTENNDINTYLGTGKFSVGLTNDDIWIGSLIASYQLAKYVE